MVKCQESGSQHRQGAGDGLNRKGAVRERGEMKQMTIDLNAIGHSIRDESKHIAELTVDPKANKFRMGKTVYKRDTGMAFEVVKVSQANGIEHYNLLCLETGSRNYLSKFALEQDYTDTNTKLDKLGLRMVKRLSEMCTK